MRARFEIDNEPTIGNCYAWKVYAEDSETIEYEGWSSTRELAVEQAMKYVQNIILPHEETTSTPEQQAQNAREELLNLWHGVYKSPISPKSKTRATIGIVRTSWLIRKNQ